MNVSNKIWW